MTAFQTNRPFSGLDLKNIPNKTQFLKTIARFTPGWIKNIGDSLIQKNQIKALNRAKIKESENRLIGMSLFKQNTVAKVPKTITPKEVLSRWQNALNRQEIAASKPTFSEASKPLSETDFLMADLNRRFDNAYALSGLGSQVKKLLKSSFNSGVTMHQKNQIITLMKNADLNIVNHNVAQDLISKLFSGEDCIDAFLALQKTTPTPRLIKYLNINSLNGQSYLSGVEDFDFFTFDHSCQLLDLINVIKQRGGGYNDKTSLYGWLCANKVGQRDMVCTNGVEDELRDFKVVDLIDILAVKDGKRVLDLSSYPEMGRPRLKLALSFIEQNISFTNSVAPRSTRLTRILSVVGKM